jgi:hypothetical protein
MTSERPYRATVQEKREWADLYVWGWTIEQVALEYGRGMNTIRNGLLKQGVQMRGPGVARSEGHREGYLPHDKPTPSTGVVHRGALNMRHHRRRGWLP